LSKEIKRTSIKRQMGHLMVRVKKFDGSLEAYSRKKVVFFCLRMGASKRDAKTIADKLEAHLYDRMSTKKIFQLASRYLRQYRPETGLRRDLRLAICLLRSKPDWELFVQLLMKEIGYDVEGNRVLRGRCVENEIDGILRKNSQTIMLEAKHHFDPHTLTSLDISRQVWATYTDLTEGFKLTYHDVNFSGAMIVCNTKFSDEGKKYADCQRIEHLSWKDPLERGLEALIEEEKFYPVTMLKEVDKETESALGDNGIVLLKQLLDTDAEKLSLKTGIRIERIERLVENARRILPPR
jgi:hypothetical protein